jgi:hypothetical protein
VVVALVALTNTLSAAQVALALIATPARLQVRFFIFAFVAKVLVGQTAANLVNAFHAELFVTGLFVTAAQIA